MIGDFRPKKSYFECHVTCDDASPNEARAVVEGLGWKFSRIDGDPIVGEGTRIYATRHFHRNKPRDEIEKILVDVAEKMSSKGLTVTRIKIEHVVFDLLRVTRS
jgi:hypothetical protein